MALAPPGWRHRRTRALGQGGARWLRVLALFACVVGVTGRIGGHHDAPSPTDQHGGSVVGWVPFGKVGSTSMRNILERRAKLYGWERFEPEHGGHVCHFRKSKACRRPMECADVPLGYVAQVAFGFCELLRNRTGRACRYATVLRDPIERIVSDWNYFCLACAEGGRFCPYSHGSKNATAHAEAILSNSRLPRGADGAPMATPLNTCPRMSLVDYAAYIGNVYTNRFDVDVSTVTTINTELCDESDAARVRRRGRQPSLQMAQRALLRPDMLVMFTEDLSHGGLDPLWRLLNESSSSIKKLDEHVGTRNAHHGQTVEPMPNETRALQSVLSSDVQLYSSVRAHHRRRRRLT